jgi:hypothetical protein
MNRQPIGARRNDADRLTPPVFFEKIASRRVKRCATGFFLNLPEDSKRK